MKLAGMPRIFLRGTRKRGLLLELALRRIVIEPLLRDAIIAPDLAGKFVQSEYPPVGPHDVEYPMDDHTIAVEDEGRAGPGRDRRRFEHLLFARGQRIAAGPYGAEVLLHRGVLSIELPDRRDEFIRLHHGDEGLHALTRR